jgi:hypothetical protein
MHAKIHMFAEKLQDTADAKDIKYDGNWYDVVDITAVLIGLDVDKSKLIVAIHKNDFAYAKSQIYDCANRLLMLANALGDLDESNYLTNSTKGNGSNLPPKPKPQS